jgi:hypothetical protein
MSDENRTPTYSDSLPPKSPISETTDETPDTDVSDAESGTEESTDEGGGEILNESDSSGSGGGGSMPPLDLGSPQSPRAPAVQSTYDSNPVNDQARKNIAYALLAIMTIIIFGAFIMASWALGSGGGLEENLKTILSLLNVVFGPVVALLGSATGFYFGVNAANRANGQ